MCHSKSASALIGSLFTLLAAASPIHAGAWELALEENFDADAWQNKWELKGSVGATDQKALLSNGKELRAKLTTKFTAPALRVELDATMTQAADDGTCSDLSVFIGDIFFQFGGENNSQTTVKSDRQAVSIPEPEPPKIEIGRTYRIVAEINGLHCKLTIDGRTAAQMVLEKPITEATLTLYTWSGKAKFDNLRVLTRAQADPQPPELSGFIDAERRKAQEEEAWRETKSSTFRQLRAAATIHSIGIEWDIEGDGNHNAACPVRYRKQGSPDWKDVLPLLRIDYRGWYDRKQYRAFRLFNMLAGSIMFLDPGAAYEVELSVNDPDGGKEQKILTVTTRSEPRLPEGGRLYHVVPGNGGGIGSLAEPFKGIPAAEAAAQPGDLFLLHKGEYPGCALTKSGESGRPIAWKAAGDGEAVFRSALGISASHLWIEGLTFEPTTAEDFGGVRGKAAGLQGIVIVRNLFRNCRYAVSNTEAVWDGKPETLHRHWFIADNVCEGGPFSEYFVRLFMLADSDICYNRMTTTFNGKGGDGIAVRFCTNLDLYHNDLHDIEDDLFEPDSAYANIRIWRNRGVNPIYTAVSFQPMLCSPWYIVQNEFVLTQPKRRGLILKANVFDRTVLVNNTFVVRARYAQVRADIVLRSVSRNNLWVHLYDNPYEQTTNPGGAIWFGYGDNHLDQRYEIHGQTLPDWKTDVDHDGFAWDCTKYHPFWWTSQQYLDLQSFSRAIGIEQHGKFLNMDEIFEVSDIVAYGLEPFSARRLTLKPGSPAIDAGARLPNLAEVFEGKAPDLGAYEFGRLPWHFGPRPP